MAYRATDKTRQHKAQVRDSIVAAGMALLRSGGFSAISMVAVAQQANIATGTLYRHFPAKADLCAVLFRLATQIEIDQIANITQPPGSARQRLSTALHTFASRALRGPQIAYALIAEPVDPAVDAERLHYRKAYCDLFARLIQEGIDAGEFPAQSTSVSAAALVGALAETLVGPLSPEAALKTQAAVEPKAGGLPDDHAELIRAIDIFCLRAITGTAQPCLEDTLS